VLGIATAEPKGACRHFQSNRESLMLELNIPGVIAEVTQAFTRYERVLVANDVAALDTLFWNSPHTLRFGIGENLYGYEAITAFRNARPPIDLKRQLQNTLIVSYGRDLATANTEFRRHGSGRTGRQSHVWLRTEAGWRIAAAHVSLMPATPSDAAGHKAEASAQTGSERG
jgi:1-carboxybiuret hydrolase subunit AtzH-like protein